MNLTISGHHLDVTPSLRAYVQSKLERITRHFDQVVGVKVLLSVEKQKEKEIEVLSVAQTRPASRMRPR